MGLISIRSDACIVVHSFTALYNDCHEACSKSSIFAQSVSVTPPASAFLSRMVIASPRNLPCSINRSAGML